MSRHESKIPLLIISLASLLVIWRIQRSAKPKIWTLNYLLVYIYHLAVNTELFNL
jgi:hypothetical protein